MSVDTFELPNGLRVVVHTTPRNPIANVNLLYDVGSRDEQPDRTGFAHLFEHLMFGGSAHIPSFDEPLDRVGGENNAFTSNDITSYYISLPRENLETAFWLESDRMLELAFSARSLEVQRQVVVEEFNQRYLNQPYGDAWLLLRPLAYRVHPYRWPTIGITPDHILQARLDEVKEFFYRYYAPNNAILSVVGDVGVDEVMALAHKWFGPIPRRQVPIRALPQEPEQTQIRQLEVARQVPSDALYLAFHMCPRGHADYPATDLLSDLLSNGKSSRLYLGLVKERRLLSSVSAYITGDRDAGLLVITGCLMPGVNPEGAQAAIFRILEALHTRRIAERELQKVKNRFEANHTFADTNPQEKALNLAYHHLLGDARDAGRTLERYRAVTPHDIQRVAQHVLRPANCSALRYRATPNPSQPTAPHGAE